MIKMIERTERTEKCQVYVGTIWAGRECKTISNNKQAGRWEPIAIWRLSNAAAFAVHFVVSADVAVGIDRKWKKTALSLQCG